MTRSSRAIDAAKRRAQAIELRRAGLTWLEIADRLEYGGRSEKVKAANACEDVSRALAELVEHPARSYVAEELSRLDGMIQALWPAARRGQLGAIDRILRIQERRARYLGLDQQPDEITGGTVTVRFATGSPEPGDVVLPTIVDLAPDAEVPT